MIITLKSQSTGQSLGKVKDADTPNCSGLQAISKGPTIPGIPRYTSVDVQRHMMLEHMAGAFRVFARKGFTEGLAGHISLRDPENRHTFWTNPLGQHFGLLTASDMVLVDTEGNAIGGARNQAVNAAGFLIHSAIHQRRPDVNAACHMHSTFGRAWSAFGKRLEMINQDVTNFYGDAQSVYDDFGGVVLEKEESERLADALGPNGKGLILRNHGILTVGQTVDEAAYLFTLMEKCCQIQIAVESAAVAGIEKKLISDEAAKYTYEQSNAESLYAEFQPDLRMEQELSRGAFQV